MRTQTQFSAALLVGVAVIVCSCGRTPDARIARARTLSQQGQLEDAQLEFRKALESDSKRPEIWRELGLVCVKLSKPDLAFESFQKALAIRPDYTEAAEDLVMLLLPSYWHSGHKAKPIADQLGQLAQVLERGGKGKSALAHRLRGHLAIGQGRSGEAISHFEAALAAKPGDADIAFLLLESVFAVKSAPEAEQFARRFVTDHPKIAPAYLQAARWFDRQGRPDEAEKYRRMRIEALPEDLGARTDLAYYLRSKGKAEAAAVVIEGLAALRASKPEARMALGDYYLRTGDFDKALAEYKAGSEASPGAQEGYRKKQISALLAKGDVAAAKALVDAAPAKVREEPEYVLGRALFDLDSGEAGRIDQAIEHLKKLQGSSATASYEVGSALLLRGSEWTAAQAAFQNAARLAPESLAPRVALMRLYAARDRYKEAVEEAEGILSIDPANSMALLLRVAALRAQGKLREAQSALTQIRQNPNVTGISAADFELEQALVLAFDGQHAQAEPLLKRHYKPGHPNIRLVATLADVLTAQGKYPECLAMLNADLQARPDRPLVLYALGEVQFRMRDAAAAQATFLRVIQAAPAMTVAHRRLAEVAMLSGQLDQAEQYVAAAVAKFPASPDVLAVAGRVYEVRGNAGEAEKCYRAWMKAEPKNPVPMNNLAFLLAENNRGPEESLKLASEATQLAPNNPDFADTLGYAYWRNGQIKASLDVYARLVKSKPEPAFRYHYALVLSSAGRKTDARVELEAALRGNPDPELRKKIQTVRTGT